MTETEIIIFFKVFSTFAWSMHPLNLELVLQTFTWREGC